MRFPGRLLVPGLVAAWVLGAGCGVSVNPRRQGFPCDPGGSCAAGLSCVGGVCVAGDGGSGGGHPDAGATDGGATDGGFTGPRTVTVIIGYAGGTVHLDGATVVFPEAALGSDTNVTLSRLDAPGTAADGPMSPVFAVAPAGLALARPAEVTLAFTGNAPDATGYWQSEAATGMERIGADAVDAAGVHFGIVRLGQGFVGTKVGHPGFTFYGTLSVTWLSEQGPVVEPTDLTGGMVEAVLPDGTRLPGSGSADGIFRIPAVPEGTRVILVQPPVPTGWTPEADGVTTSGQVLDASRLVAGRPSDAQPRITSATSVLPQYAGLVPEAGGSTASCFVPAIRLRCGSIKAPANATSVTASHAEHIAGLLPDSAHPATAVALQLTHPSQSVLKSASTAVATGTTTLAIPDGSSTTLSFSMDATVPDKTLDATIDESAFTAALGTPPNAVTPISPAGVRLEVTPGHAAFGDLHAGGNPSATLSGYSYDASTQLVSAGLAGTSGSAAISLDYADGLPQAWRRTWEASVGVALHEPGSAAGTIYGEVWVSVTGPLGAIPTPIRPVLGVPTGITIDGKPAQAAPLTGVGLTPTVTWTAPAVGTAVAYGVEVYSDTGQIRARFLVPAPPFEIPAGLLVAGHSFQIKVVAFAAGLPGHPISLSGSPERSLPWTQGTATALTEPLTP